MQRQDEKGEKRMRVNKFDRMALERQRTGEVGKFGIQLLPTVWKKGRSAQLAQQDG